MPTASPRRSPDVQRLPPSPVPGIWPNWTSRTRWPRRSCAGRAKPAKRRHMSSDPGLHAVAGQKVSADAYDRYIGRWSRLTVPSLLAAAEIGSGDRVLDVATGTGEAAIAAISLVGDAGVVVGADISAAMLGAACARLPESY